MKGSCVNTASLRSFNMSFTTREDQIVPYGTSSGTRRLIWLYGPLVVWMALIFLGSSDQLSATNTASILRPLLRFLIPTESEGLIDTIHFVLRKCGHLTEYAVLGFLAARAFRGTGRSILANNWFVWGLLLVTVYALSDEFHQSWVPARTATIYDTIIDTAGGLIALLVVKLWVRRRNKTEKRNGCISR
jgi:VanZ family protein